MKILIVVPTFENIYPDTFKAIYDLDKGNNEVLFEYVRGYDVATARNRATSKAFELGADYLLMIDNDVVIPKHGLTSMLSRGKDVVLGLYARRDNDNVYHGRTCIYKLYDEKGEAYYDYPTESGYTAEEVAQLKESGAAVRVHGGGLGCALIKMDVFNRISWPWFKWVIYEDGHGTLSEDLYFCEQCRMAGINIFTDPQVTCGHMLRHVQDVFE